MKTIGFVDYFIDEWHANTYPKMIKAYNEAHGTDYAVRYVWAEIDSPVAGGLTTTAWCEAHGAVLCDSIEALCLAADHVIVLAPSNPEKHKAYAEAVFRAGKSAYIDKTFTETAAEAQEIADLAAACGVQFFSTSALRYAKELTPYLGKTRAIRTTGGGSNVAEYLVHQVEMVVACLGTGAARVRCTKNGEEELFEVAYPDGRLATMLYGSKQSFTVTVDGEEGKPLYLPVKSAFFDGLIADILGFFENGVHAVPFAQTKEVMRVREGALAARALNGAWYAL